MVGVANPDISGGTRTSGVFDYRYPSSQKGATFTGTSGTLTDGSSYTLSGAGFNTKPTAAPVLFDDFEAGTTGNYITDSTGISETWENYSGGAVGPIYSTAQSYSGTKSALRATPVGADWNSAGIKGLNTTEFYLSSWFRWKHTAGTYVTSPQVKYHRVNSTPDGDFYNGTSSSPSLAISAQPSGNSVFSWFTLEGTTPATTAITDILEDVWVRMEIHIKMSTPDEDDGLAYVWSKGVLSDTSPTGNITRTKTEKDKVIDNFLLPGMSDGANDSMDFYSDDVYVDTTIARVEVSLSATWSGAAANKDVMVPTAWADGSVTVTLRGLTAMGAGTKYAYIIDRFGTVNETGYAIS